MGLSTLYYTIFMPYLPLRRASAISVHRPQNKPMASAYSDLPYVATMFRNILRLGQGIGRLIRSKTDTGIIVVLDPRIMTKSYGKSFLESIPECPVEHF